MLMRSGGRCSQYLAECVSPAESIRSENSLRLRKINPPSVRVGLALRLRRIGNRLERERRLDRAAVAILLASHERQDRNGPKRNGSAGGEFRNRAIAVYSSGSSQKDSGSI